ncbi:winged helix-turn-helix transcriptional regulator [Cupriavidus basilensis]
MQRKTFRNMQCPIARGLERVGEWWSMLLMREAFYGARRFDDFQKNLGYRAQHAHAPPDRAG